jgi:hypothetical protein
MLMLSENDLQRSGESYQTIWIVQIDCLYLQRIIEYNREAGI